MAGVVGVVEGEVAQSGELGFDAAQPRGCPTPTLRIVTYDLLLVRRRPGRTLQQSLDDGNAEYDPDAAPEPMDLSEDQRAVWDRIVQRVTTEIGPVTSEEFLYSLTL